MFPAEILLEVSTFTSTDRFNLNGGSKSLLCVNGVSGMVSGSSVFGKVLHGMVAAVVGSLLSRECCGVCSLLNDKLPMPWIKKWDQKSDYACRLYIFVEVGNDFCSC